MTERMRIGLLLAMTLLVYSNTLLNDFTYDDEGYILRNPAVKTASVSGLFQPTKGNNIFRPFTFATFALNWATAGARPFSYHVVNLLLHAAVVLLLYFVLQMLLAAVAGGPLIAFVSVLLFAVHPIHTEAVASIVGRGELLAAGFLLAAWFLHLKERPVAAMLCFVFALLSKESAVVFLLLVLAGDFAIGKLQPLSRYGWIAGLTVVYLAVLWKLQGGQFQKSTAYTVGDNPLASLPVLWRILNALRVAWKYVGLQIYPRTLSYDYSYNAILLYARWRQTLPAALATAVVLILWFWTARTKRSAWMLAGAIYLAGFAVTANIFVSTGTIMGERLAYLPSIGFCLLVALLWSQLKNRSPLVAWASLVLVVVGFSARTMIRNQDWHDNFTLYAAGVQAVPRSVRAHLNFGDEFLRVGQLEPASQEYRTALLIYPDSEGALARYGIVQSRLGRDQEARPALTRALALTKTDDQNYDFMALNLAAVLMNLGENDDALRVLNREVDESRAETRVWSNRAVIRYRRGEFDAARTDVEKALQLNPANTQAQSVLNDLNGRATVPSR